LSLLEFWLVLILCCTLVGFKPSWGSCKSTLQFFCINICSLGLLSSVMLAHNKGYMNFGPDFRPEKKKFLLQNQIALTLIFISHRAEIPGRKIRGPKFRAPHNNCIIY
jgi:hypothetical protein